MTQLYSTLLPDLITSFNSLMHSQQSAYMAGLIAAFTPCTLAIVPLFLYRFGIWNFSDGKKARVTNILRDLALLVIGFLASFGVAGLLLQNLLSSELVNITRLVLGYSLVLLGILQLSGKLSLQFVARVSHPLLIGIVTPWIISLSPCVLPYFAGLVATAVSGDSVLRFVLFGLGILTPAMILAFAGNRLMTLLHRLSKPLIWIERWAAILIILSGFYISAELVTLTSKDVLVAGAILIVEVILIAVQIFRLRTQHTLQNYSFISLLLILSIIATFALATQTTSTSAVSGSALLKECGNMVKTSCVICNVTSTVFAAIAAGLAIAYIFSSRKGRLVKFTLKAESETKKET